MSLNLNAFHLHTAKVYELGISNESLAVCRELIVLGEILLRQEETHIRLILEGREHSQMVTVAVGYGDQLLSLPCSGVEDASESLLCTFGPGDFVGKVYQQGFVLAPYYVHIGAIVLLYAAVSLDADTGRIGTVAVLYVPNILFNEGDRILSDLLRLLEGRLLPAGYSQDKGSNAYCHE